MTVWREDSGSYFDSTQTGQAGKGISQDWPSKQNVPVRCPISAPQSGQYFTLEGNKLEVLRKSAMDSLSPLFDAIGGLQSTSVAQETGVQSGATAEGCVSV